MHRSLQQLADTDGGVVVRRAALQVVDHTVIDRAATSGDIVRVCPKTFVDAARGADRRTLLRAVARYGGEHGALSHTSALEVWRLPAPATGPIHLTVEHGHQLRGATGVRVHRRKAPLDDVAVRDRMRVVRVERAVVDSWPLLELDAGRAPAIVAVNRRMTTPDRLMAAVEQAPRIGGRRGLVRLVELLQAGCRSQLELWGYQRVFVGAGFEGLRWQAPVRIGGHTVYLDAFDAGTGVDFELDGTEFHAGLADRERDLRRDAALQAEGFTVVRFSHARLRRDPDGVRRDALAVMGARAGAWLQHWRRPSSAG
ncbi:DUF559 domain-containing protein [Dactylosporangium sp. NPDC049525]|uniref:DUF559 domain-containing protein n=1 Tax=Dactylosporangium sp. NPDC049525 TaxID=3154730 RepID=UPI003445DD94